MNKTQLVILFFFAVILASTIYFSLTETNTVSYCLDGDDIIDDDLCVTVNDNIVDIYPALEKEEFIPVLQIIGLVMLTIISGCLIIVLSGDF